MSNFPPSPAPSSTSVVFNVRAHPASSRACARISGNNKESRSGHSASLRPRNLRSLLREMSSDVSAQLD
eukprot:751146-Hanusia_phi.AAC.4